MLPGCGWMQASYVYVVTYVLRDAVIVKLCAMAEEAGRCTARRETRGKATRAALVSEIHEAWSWGIYTERRATKHGCDGDINAKTNQTINKLVSW